MSWLTLPPNTDFTWKNLPYGVFRPPGDSPRVGVALGDRVVDLARVLEDPVFAHPSLNPFMARGPGAWRATRQRLLERLQSPVDEAALFRQNQVEMLLPIEPADYVDFYSSLEHATNVGTMFRGAANALNPNWKHIPIGYHGRAGSLVVSGHEVRRPHGQLKPSEEAPPVFGPSRSLDFELEMAFLVGKPSQLGSVVPIAQASEHVFGMIMLNDWSARDIQKWEYVPLGPFLGKSFATSVSPWVVTMEALEPYRVEGPEQDPEPLAYLANPPRSNYDIALEVWLQSPSMAEPVRICQSNTRYLYWSIPQQLAHLSSNGSPLRVGDVCASGTISGPEKSQRGSMLELSWGGKEPLELPDGSRRSFLQDGDTVTFRAWAGHGEARVGFGEVRGTIVS